MLESSVASCRSPGEKVGSLCSRQWRLAHSSAPKAASNGLGTALFMLMLIIVVVLILGRLDLVIPFLLASGSSRRGGYGGGGGGFGGGGFGGGGGGFGGGGASGGW